MGRKIPKSATQPIKELILDMLKYCVDYIMDFASLSRS